MNTQDIKELQLERLKEELNYLKENSAFYKKIINNCDIDIDNISSLKDLERFPFTTKKDLQMYNDEFICVDKHNIFDYVTTSGTLCDPVTFALTKSALDRLAYNELSSFTTAGLTKSDIIQLMITIY